MFYTTLAMVASALSVLESLYIRYVERGDGAKMILNGPWNILSIIDDLRNLLKKSFGATKFLLFSHFLIFIFYFLAFNLFISFKNLKISVYCKTPHWSEYNIKQNVQLDLQRFTKYSSFTKRFTNMLHMR